MKKIIPALIVLVIVVVGFILLENKKPTNKNNSMNMNSSNSTNTTSQNTDKVSITNFSFSPSSITVKKGMTVTWTNHDSVAHTVVETDGKTGPNSHDINNGQSYSFTYTSVGTFAYKCSIHPEMVGSITVTE